MFNIIQNLFNIELTFNKSKKRGYYFDYEENAIYRDDIPIDKRLDLVNHSPLGLNCGYSGSGPRQAALAILSDFTKNDEFALKYYDEFFNDVISQLSQNSQLFKFIVVQNWVDEKMLMNG